MSAAAQTKIFGIRVGIDPKWLVGGLIAVAVVMFWFNSRSEEHATGRVVSSSAGGIDTAGQAQAVPSPGRARPPRRSSAITNERGLLRLKPVDAQDGKVDPTLRLYLLDRLQSLQAATPGRSLFETGPSPEQIASAQSPIPGPKIPISTLPANPQPVDPAAMGSPTVNIPLKFYGFVNPESKKETSRGLFLDGDNILIAAEGDLVNRRYLVVQLSANSARLEDVEIKQGQTLPVVPEAMTQ